MEKKKFKLSSIIKLGVLCLLLYLVFRGHTAEIIENIKSAEPLLLLLILGMGLIYLGFDSAACRSILGSGLPDISYKQSVGITYLGLFCQVTTFSAGIMPAQSLYLYRLGMEPGDSIGLLMMKFTVHKAAILTYSALILLFSSSALLPGRGELRMFALIGWCVGAAIIGGIILLCSLPGLRELLKKIALRLPDKGSWPRRREKILENIELLYSGVKSLKAQPGRLIRAYVCNLLKFAVFYSIPYFALRAIGAELSFFTAFSLAGLCHVIASALPNVAGMGPIEAAFVLLFSVYLSEAQASSALVLFRLSTYFFPFLISVIFVIKMQKSL